MNNRPAINGVGPRTYSHLELTQQLRILGDPDLSEVKNVLEPALREHFNEANVSVVPCPDLRDSPFFLGAPGLDGETTIMELGSTQYLGEYPVMPDMSKSWVLTELVQQFCRKPSSFVIGASRALKTFHSEVATNFIYRKSGHAVTNNSYFNFMNEDKRFESDHVTNPERVVCDLYGNFFICEGNSGDVLKVYAKGRQTDKNFPTIIQDALQRRYGSNLVGLGGTFVIHRNAKVKNMIRRPRFDSDKPVRNEFDKNVFYDTDAPLVAVGTILSDEKCTTDHSDFMGPHGETRIRLESDVTTEHFHTFAYRGGPAGGHFINDSLYCDVQYEGYFNTAFRLIRVDPPSMRPVPCSP